MFGANFEARGKGRIISFAPNGKSCILPALYHHLVSYLTRRNPARALERAKFTNSVQEAEGVRNACPAASCLASDKRGRHVASTINYIEETRMEDEKKEGTGTGQPVGGATGEGQQQQDIADLDPREGETIRGGRVPTPPNSPMED